MVDLEMLQTASIIGLQLFEDNPAIRKGAPNLASLGTTISNIRALADDAYVPPRRSSLAPPWGIRDPVLIETTGDRGGNDRRTGNRNNLGKGSSRCCTPNR